MSSEAKPVVYILHGDDRFSIQKVLQEMIARLGDPGMAELNITRLEGKQTSLAELSTAVNSLPFLSDRRMVIVTNPIERGSRSAERDKWLNLLNTMPDTTALVLIIEDQQERREWVTLKPKHWLRLWAAEAGTHAWLQTYSLPKPPEMPAWIRTHALLLGGEFAPQAANELALHTGSDTEMADREIEKLLTYVNFQRPVTLEEVQLLTSEGGPLNVFEMVDALAEGDARRAQRLLHGLLEQQDAFSLFGMIVRQFRLLIQVRELLDEGKGIQSIVSTLRLHEFVAKKLISQSERFTMSDLEVIYHRLLTVDEQIKTSQMDADIALDVFVTELAVK